MIHPRVTGGERGRTQEDGKLTGPHYQKLPRHAVNSSSVGVQHAREDANVPIKGVLHFATYCGELCSHS